MYHFVKLHLLDSECHQLSEITGVKTVVSFDLLTCNVQTYLHFSEFYQTFLEKNKNKTPADQQDIFRPNCSSNDIYLRLKSSHYTMKTLRGLMGKGLTLFENVMPFQKETL